MWCTLLLLVTLLDGSTYENSHFGFRVELPDGWSATERSAGDQSLNVVFRSPEYGDSVQLSVMIATAGGMDAEDRRRASISAVAASPDYTDPREETREIAGQPRPAVVIDANVSGTELLLRQAYLTEHGLSFVLQDFAPRGMSESLAPKLDAVWDGFAFTELSPEQAERQQLIALAARCGSEIDWAADWEEAAARARATRRPILLAARMYAGFSISDERMSGPFMDQDLIALVNERYVPLDVGKQDVASLPLTDPDVYGMGPLTFGTAVLIVKPDGEVLIEFANLIDELLRAGTALDPDLPGPPVPDGLAGFELAELHYHRGELAEASELLDDAATARELLLVARIRTRERNGAAALAAIEEARAADDAGPYAMALDVLEAKVRTVMGEPDRGIALLDATLASHPDGELVPPALLLRGYLTWAQESQDAAEPWLRRVVDEHGGTRWAWAAAATLTGTAWSIDVTGPTAWPPRDLWSTLVPPTWLARTEGERDGDADARAWIDARLAVDVEAAADEALSRVLSSQREDGSWIGTSTLGRAPDDVPDDFELAITAICATSLLPARNDPEVSGAIVKAFGWLIASYERMREEGTDAYFMDYSVWSRAYLLGFVAEAAAAGIASPDRLSPMVDLIVDELIALQKPSDGWSYYVTGDVTSTADPTSLAMSFTTSAIVLSLLRAREVGFEIPDEPIERGLDCLERARKGDVFAYLVGPEGEVGTPTGRAGASGRGPVCALALYRGGRADLDLVRTALEVFDEQRGTLSSETGKSLMHTGPEGQGSHYLIFDYRNAAAAIASLPVDERARFRPGVLEELMRTRAFLDVGGDIIWVDNPIIGHDYGAGMALLALRDLSDPGPWGDLAYAPPTRLATDRLLLEPLTADHVELDFAALMGSREHLQRTLRWGDWPTPDFTVEENRGDLQRHWDEFERREGYAFTVLAPDRSRCLGCVYLNPAGEREAALAYWVVEDELDSELDRHLLEELLTWFERDWAFDAVAMPVHGDNVRGVELADDLGLARSEDAGMPEHVVFTWER